MSMPLKVIYRANIKPFKMLMAFFTEIEKIVWKSQIAKVILEKEKKKKAEGITFLSSTYIAKWW